jgi:hypothetical protein
VVIAALVLTGMALLWPQQTVNLDVAASDTDRIKGTITALEQVPCEDEGFQGSESAEALDKAGYTPDPDCAALNVRIDEGPESGESFETVTGSPPVLTAVVGAGAVMLVVLLLAHGWPAAWPRRPA